MTRHLQVAKDSQVFYQGRWVPREHFRVFIYSLKEKKLVNSYEEYCTFIESGLFFPTQEEVPQYVDVNQVTPITTRRRRRSSDGANR